MKHKKPKDIFEQEAKIRLKTIKSKHRKPYQKKRVLIPSIIMLFLVFTGIMSFIDSLQYQSTDDAFIEGRFVAIAPKVSGNIVKLNFNDNDFVKKGQLLLEIDSRDYENKVKELESSLKEAKANRNVSSDDTEKSEADLAQANKNLNFTTRDFDRYKKLKKEGLCTKQEFDSAETAYKQAKDREKSLKASVKSGSSKQDVNSAIVEKTEAQLAQAKLNLSYTKIYAPQDGNISARNVEIGNYVQVGQVLTSIVSQNVWVIANFKETQLTNMKKGQSVAIKIDTYPSKKFKGKIDSIQRASGAKTSLFPPENAVGSYVKVVQRIPVKILFDEDISQFNITPGMSVVPRVKIK
ncbi:MAG: HlyD family secretion protein [Candidatus Gastranaerophilales bacterium]|nr:HlyD family secretion protein [Candidatus Gastranaerophilales bacterium]